jgi:hypothetical protein
MRSPMTTSSKRRRLARPGVRVAIVAAAGLMLASAPARAGDFKDGFQDQLGRIAAVQVVNAGQLLLAAGLVPWGALRAPYGPPPLYDGRFHRWHPRPPRHGYGPGLHGHDHAPDATCGAAPSGYDYGGGTSGRYVYERYDWRR